MGKERLDLNGVGCEKSLQYRLEVLSWLDQGAPAFWLPSQPELVSAENEGKWRTLRLSSIPQLERRLETVGSGQLPSLPSTESLVRTQLGSSLHRLYTLGLFLLLVGQPEMVSHCFPTLKEDCLELEWIRDTINQVLPVFKDNQEKGLEALWLTVFAKTEEEMMSRWPLLIRPEDGIDLDEVFRLWRASDDLFDRGYSLIKYLLNLEEVLPYHAEKSASHRYFELGVICFVNELKVILIARLDELVSRRQKGKKRETWVIDFKSGPSPAKWSEADFIYYRLMTMLGERLTSRYLLGGKGIEPGSGYIKLGINEFSSAASRGRAETLFRHLEGAPGYRESPNRKERLRMMTILNSWTEEMARLKITSI